MNFYRIILKPRAKSFLEYFPQLWFLDLIVKKLKFFRVFRLMDDHEDEALLKNRDWIRAIRLKVAKTPDFQLNSNLLGKTQLFHFIDRNSVLKIYCFGQTLFEISGKSKKLN
jgi:hypothetical protein